MARSALFGVLLNGKSYTKLEANRCVTSKSETARSARRFRASCANPLDPLESLAAEIPTPSSIDFDHVYEVIKLSPLLMRRSARAVRALKFEFPIDEM